MYKTQDDENSPKSIITLSNIYRGNLSLQKTWVIFISAKIFLIILYNIEPTHYALAIPFEIILSISCLIGIWRSSKKSKKVWFYTSRGIVGFIFATIILGLTITVGTVLYDLMS